MPRRFGLTTAEMRGLEQVRIGAAARRAMLSSARRAAAAGGEACAALYGTADGPVLRIGMQRQLDNAASGACLAVPVASLLGGGCPDRLVGLFHSHPRSEAVPSDLDRLAIARLPFVWAIAGATGGWTVRFFAWSAAGLRELPEQASRQQRQIRLAHKPAHARSLRQEGPGHDAADLGPASLVRGRHCPGGSGGA